MLSFTWVFSGFFNGVNEFVNVCDVSGVTSRVYSTSHPVFLG